MMNNCSSSKRMKFSNENLYALNLSMTRCGDDVVSKNESSIDASMDADADADANEMRNKFQQWVLQTYKDASKTKTITAKKYERIVKTLRGEIKNCAENSKFRFWMKCKGFKLEFVDGDKTLYVLDKKGETTRYKKVAIVEDFFDIIYKVHVNEGARGVQHAGQKRTHRSITETYAFLPREAVTKFLMCCVQCQKRTTEDRKTSPLISSSSSHDSTCQNSILNENSKLNEFSNVFECEREREHERQSVKVHEHGIEPCNIENVKLSHSPKNYPTYESNNNDIIINKKENSSTSIHPNNGQYVIIKLNENHDNNDNNDDDNNDGSGDGNGDGDGDGDSINVTKLTRPTYHCVTNKDYDDTSIEKLGTRKRKRKFTRKIVRPSLNVELCDPTTYSSFCCSTSTPFRDVGRQEFSNLRIDSMHSSGDSTSCQIPSMKSNFEFCKRKFSTDDATANVTQLEKVKINVAEESDLATGTNCPYLNKISQILFNPINYATTVAITSNKRTSTSNEDFLEQQAADLILKARELDAIKEKLTENQKQQISEKIYNSRIVSFLLNYAADLMLRSL